jgi:hypothetical protein
VVTQFRQTISKLLILTTASTIGPFLAALFFYFSFVINSFRWYPPRGDYNTNQQHKVRTGGGRTKSSRLYLFLTIDIKSLAAHGPGSKHIYYMRLLFMIPPKNNRFWLFSWFILRHTSLRVVCYRRVGINRCGQNDMAPFFPILVQNRVCLCFWFIRPFTVKTVTKYSGLPTTKKTEHPRNFGMRPKFWGVLTQNQETPKNSK